MGLEPEIESVSGQPAQRQMTSLPNDADLGVDVVVDGNLDKPFIPPPGVSLARDCRNVGSPALFCR